jgi:diadenosine tetraphosphatase ApaH/serine/threonine PP2A family protein phosphatase
VTATEYGFKDEVASLYTEAVFDDFVDAFQWMPIAAVINDSIFCVHGGLAPGLRTVSQISLLKRPLTASDDNPILMGLLWNDPSQNDPGFAQRIKNRGLTFGRGVIKQFFETNHLTYMIRGHQCCDGVDVIPGMNVATVFSTSNYNARGNRAGVIFVAEGGSVEYRVFVGIAARIFRADVTFAPITRRQPGLRLSASLVLGSPALNRRGSRITAVTLRRSASRSCGWAAVPERRNALNAGPSFLAMPCQHSPRANVDAD